MLLGAIAGTGWASGLNVYAVIAVLGVAGRAGWVDTPAELQHGWVIAIATAMYAVEFVIDKIPYVDNAWDAVHTFIRPGLAAAIGAFADGGPRGAVIAGALALTSHGAKATARLAINVSPEPVSNTIASLTEDGIVAGALVLALTHPRVAGVLAIIAAIACVIVIVVLWRFALALLGKIRSTVLPR